MHTYTSSSNTVILHACISSCLRLYCSLSCGDCPAVSICSYTAVVFHKNSIIFTTVLFKLSFHRTQAGSDTGGAKEPLLLEDGSLELPLSCSVTCLWEFLVQYCHRIIERRQKHERCVWQYIPCNIDKIFFSIPPSAG